MKPTKKELSDQDTTELCWKGPLVAQLSLHTGRALVVWIGSVGLEFIPISVFVCRAYRSAIRQPFNWVDFKTHPSARQKGRTTLADERTAISYLTSLGIPYNVAFDATNKLLDLGGWPSLPKDYYLIAKEDTIESREEPDNG